MFKFDFDIEDAEDSEDLLNLGISSLNIQATPTKDLPTPELELEPFSEISLQQLVDAVPDQISYSPLSIPLSSSRKSTTLIRRDLFDARFQLISEGAGDAVDDQDGPAQENSNVDSKLPDFKAKRQALAFLDAPSDLVPGVYEGGLKTWECSLDIVDYLESQNGTRQIETFEGKRILEVGCGTGVPSMFIFRELLSSISTGNSSRTEIHLQDYNPSVLQLVTFPNLLLTWYTSNHADAYRSTTNDTELAPTIDPQNAGELQITPDLKSAFLKSLQTLNISLRFFSGSWDTFDPTNDSPDSPSHYNILLTSETIYRTDSLRPLINLMRKACIGAASSESTIEKNAPVDDYLCLVAAKVLYFGVGGGVSDFLTTVKGEKARVETVLERSVGVGRKIMKVHW